MSVVGAWRVVWVMVLAGCGPGDVQLFVDLKTDLRPGFEFTSVETLVTDGDRRLIRRAVLPATRAEDYLEGRRIVEVVDLTPGNLALEIRLLDPSGALVAGREALVSVRASTAITVIITRDCAGLQCPEVGSPELTECLGGRCVSPECAADPSACPELACESDDECASAVACAPRRCMRGVCYALADDTRCGADQWCNPELGCLARDLTDGGVPGCLAGTPCETGRACELGRVECTDAGSVCVPSGVAAAGSVCRAASGECDAAEVCDGTSPSCPADALAAAGTSCAAGVCDGLGGCAACTAGAPCSTGDACARGAIVCEAGGARCAAAGPAAAGTACRAAIDACDVAEQCDGVSTSCPADRFADASVVCRGAAGPCDRAERCTGTGAACPADAVLPTSTVCRSAAGPCDVEERCAGGVACPMDGYASSGVCRAADGDCDQEERCDGAGPACPTDRFASGGVCRGVDGVCDQEERCDGAGPDCPRDQFRSGNVCRAASGMCDVAESCSGSSPDCPTDRFVPNGTGCGDTWSELSCGPVDVDRCEDGACVHDGNFEGDRPSCGAIGALCGITPRCCGGAGYFCVAEAGNPIYGSSFDCGQCCRAGRCCIDGNPAGPCI